MSEKKPVVDAEEPRVSFGIPQLDSMLSGGLMPHRPYLVVGPAGTGKTSLALQFLCEGVRRGESVLYVTLEDPPNEIRRNHRSLKPELDRIEVFDAIPDVMRYERIPFKDISSVRDVVPFAEVSEEIRQTPEFTSTEVTIAALEQFLRTQTYRRRYTRMVVDSLTALQYFCMKGLDPVLGAQTFLRFLSDLRVTAVLTVESPVEGQDTPERMLSRGEVRMFRWERDGVTVRAVGVEKLRGSAHDTRMHPYRIGPAGIDINLGVTVSRDTRGIAESALRVEVAAPWEPALPAPARPRETLAEEIQDLLALGADPAILRPEVEAALNDARNGRGPQTAAHVSQLASLTRALAITALAARASAPAALDSEPARRVAERAERAREGSPPSRLPSTDVLQTELEAVLGLLTPPSPLSEATVAAVLPSTPAVAPLAPAEPDESMRAAPRRRASPGAGISEPPPLPSLAPTERVKERAPVAPEPRGELPEADASTSLRDSPPLPTPLPSALESDLIAAEPAPTSKPAPKRKRRSVASRSSARLASSETVAEDGTLVAPAKPKRRVVRRKKAPPVVSATAEPLPPSPEDPAPSPSPPDAPVANDVTPPARDP